LFHRTSTPKSVLLRRRPESRNIGFTELHFYILGDFDCNGVVEAVGNNTITVKVAENVKVRLGKSYIATLRPPTEED